MRNTVFFHERFQIGRRSKDNCIGCAVFKRYANVDIIVAVVRKLGKICWNKN